MAPASTKRAAAPKKTTAKAAAPKKTTAKADAQKKTAAPKKTDTKAAAPKKTPARKAAAPVKTTVAKRGSTSSVKPVMLNGKPAKNRHFLVDRRLYDSALAKCQEDRLVISDVLRFGIKKYGDEAPPIRKSPSGKRILPDDSLADLCEVWESGDSNRATHYLAALHRGGWTVQSIADSLVASGAVEKMTRQAVNLRVVKAPEELMDGLPRVPEVGPRRTIVSPRKGQKGAPRPTGKKTREQVHDVAFRVEDEVYAVAANRARSEGAMISGVLDSILLSYVEGAYDKDLVGSAPEK